MSQMDTFVGSVGFVGPGSPKSALGEDFPIIVGQSSILSNYVVTIENNASNERAYARRNPSVPRSETLQVQANIALGKRLAEAASVNWECLYNLGMRESGWDNTVYNKGGSGAFGIPQALPASKLDAYGNRYDAEVQIRWMIDYVNQRYGGSCQALRFQIANGWY